MSIFKFLISYFYATVYLIIDWKVEILRETTSRNVQIYLSLVFVGPLLFLPIYPLMGRREYATFVFLYVFLSLAILLILNIYLANTGKLKEWSLQYHQYLLKYKGKPGKYFWPMFFFLLFYYPFMQALPFLIKDFVE